MEFLTAIITFILLTVVVFLCGLGLYGVISYGIDLRKLELGTRMAIGASKVRLLKMILKENTLYSALGVILSSILVCSILMAKNKMEEFDTVTLLNSLLLSSTLLLLVVLISSSLPLNRFFKKSLSELLRGS